ncbi:MULTISPECIES: TIGR03557 family F420-dependent LLM class oxidoreductase [Mumia]|uniref:TIGR03557 family F420-dependent LLM class oxidoreductase n=1 Tax=Mumia xiangluensis TaxID=1678900 RepID=A0ABW1QJ30_9ACTN|nr:MULTISPECIES: TIGR03557 family F420-dependent LLM class oxidoreductase [Mumia]
MTTDRLRIGFKLMAESFDPLTIVDQAVAAEEAGFDFVEVSDHFHPWLYSQQHSGFAFSMLGAIAARTTHLGLATGVTCPIMRYHPAIVAQMAATTAVLSRGRFTLGVGSGENLNEHIVGGGWPSVSVRHDMLSEALEIIHTLFTGGYHSYSGQYFDLEDARIFDLPDTPPKIVVAAGGEEAAKLAAELGDGLFATEPKAEIVDAYATAGGNGPRYAEVPLAYSLDIDAAAEAAHRTMRFGLAGWKVQAELPNPVNFEAATASVRIEDMRAAFGCGPDTERHLEVAQRFLDTGFDNLVLMNAGPPEEMGAFFEHVRTSLRPRLEDLAS